ncbi:MAG: FAD:protein FMN transferase [Pseudomonadota bacterium]
MTLMTRRRFLAVTAATGAIAGAQLIRTDSPASAEWSGRAFGADVSIKLYGDGDAAETALADAQAAIQRMENQFSVYDPASALSRLNADGVLPDPTSEFLSLVRACDTLHQRTHGLFDPSIQSLFQARKTGLSDHEARRSASIGWKGVRFDNTRIRLRDRDMALTFNGIAQGFATDAIKALMQRYGFDRSLINIGEYAAGNREATIGIADEGGRLFDTATIRNQAIATSSPGGFRFPDGSSHILSPKGKSLEPVWKTVSVIAPTATVADGCSTALCLAEDTRLAERLTSEGLIEKVILQDEGGRTVTI